MRSFMRKTVIAAIASVGLACAAAATSTPAEAQWHGGFHGGWGGGWHGGGWGGGWRGGWAGGPAWGWRRAGWGPGWGGGWGWGGGCWNCGWGWDPGWAIAAATVPVGVAIAANAAQPSYGGPGCWVRRRVWTAGGHYLGRRLINLCY